MIDKEREFLVAAVTTVTATFMVFAEDEEDAKEQVESALVTGPHSFDFNIDVPNAQDVRDEGWDVTDVRQE